MCYFYMMTISSAPFQVLSANPDPHLPFTLYRKRTCVKFMYFNLCIFLIICPLHFTFIH